MASSPMEPTETREPMEAQDSGYVRLFELARGGLGAVEVAVRRGHSFERLYAMKRLLPHVSDQSDMLLREARIAGLVRHANVASVLDVGVDGDGPYLVMDYVDGISLRELVQRSGPDDLLPVQICVDIAAQVARGLHAAHDMRGHRGQHMVLIHRDVSPQNILLGFDGIVRVGDFGIAKVLGASSDTTTGLLKGKLGYMSPEQLRFEPLDPRSDLYSLGVVLWETLASRRLYPMAGRDYSEVARCILNEPAPDIVDYRRDVPPELEQLLMDLMAKEPGERPATAREAAERLEAISVEVAALEGTHRLEGWLAERFADVRAGRETRIATALAELNASQSREEALGVVGGDAPPVGAGAGPGRSRAVMVAVVCVALAAAAVAVALSMREGAAAEEAAPVAAEAPVEEAPVEEQAPVEEATDVPSDGDEDVAEAEGSDPEEGEAGAAPEEAGQAGASTERRRRARRRPRRSPAKSGSSGDGWWPRR